MNQIPFVQLPADQPTSYIGGGRTRNVDGSIPHLSQVLTVGRLGGLLWRLSPASAADWARVQADVVAAGGEPVRLTEALRDQTTVQAGLRIGYENWVKAGRPAPGTATYNTRTMHVAFAAKPGESTHGPGMAVDLDVGALVFPGCARGSDAALEKFWTIAAVHGWRPIIAHPDASASEAWHFDHIDGLDDVRALFAQEQGGVIYNHVARVANALAGTIPRSVVVDVTVAYVQARLLLAGYWCGVVDGSAGPKTRAAFKAAEVEVATRASPVEMVAALGPLGVAQIEAL